MVDMAGLAATGVALKASLLASATSGCAVLQPAIATAATRNPAA